MPVTQKTSVRRPRTLRQPAVGIMTHVSIAVGAFLAASVVLLVMVTQAQTLVRFGLVGNLYYVLLVPLGLTVAVFLFGVLRSYAVYVGKVEGGSIELGGPIVAFVLVVVLGFYLIPNAQPFALTVFVHGETGRHDLILRSAGSLMIDLGGDRRRARIDDNGQAFFAGIPPNFRGQSISVALEAPGYELAAPNSTIILQGDATYVAIRAKAAELAGYVRSNTGQPIAGATVSVGGSSVQTDASGFFALTLPRAGPRQSLTMHVAASGFDTWNGQVVPGGNEIDVVLDRPISGGGDR